MTETVLSLHDLGKSFGRKRALDGVTFEVRRGEIVGFLGPNGAGKSTVMKIAMGLLAPDRGTVTLFGVPDGAARADLRMRVGYLQEKPPVYPEMTARDYLTFFARLYEVPEAGRRVEEVLDGVALREAADRRLAEFSRGMQQRTCLARVMLHQPDFLLLDEPTLGLDPAGVAEMRQIFRDMRARGTTLMFSSHQLSEVEAICDSLVFLSRGRVIAEGRSGDLLPGGAEGGTVTGEVAEPATAVASALGALPAVLAAEVEGPHRLKLRLAETERPLTAHERRLRASRLLTGAGFTVLGVTHAEVGLEELFLRLAREDEVPPRAA